VADQRQPDQRAGKHHPGDGKTLDSYDAPNGRWPALYPTGKAALALVNGQFQDSFNLYLAAASATALDAVGNDDLVNTNRTVFGMFETNWNALFTFNIGKVDSQLAGKESEDLDKITEIEGINSVPMNLAINYPFAHWYPVD
jgi:hypothetical protein